MEIHQLLSMMDELRCPKCKVPLDVEEKNGRVIQSCEVCGLTLLGDNAEESQPEKDELPEVQEETDSDSV